MVLAVAERDGVKSEQLSRVIADKPVAKPIDTSMPTKWIPSKGFSFTDTRTTYGFIARLKKHLGIAGGLRFNVQAASGTWSELNLSEDVELDGERIERIIEGLREIVADGEVSIDAKRLRFDTGQRFNDYIAELKANYQREEVEQ